MQMDFHSVVMQGPFWSHNSYCILTWGRVRELWVSLIYKSTHLIEEGPSLQLHNLTKASPRGNITMGIRISSYEISGGCKAETVADTKVNWLFLLQWLSSPTLHWSSFPASPCSHSIHSITLGFTSPGQSSVSSISYSAYSMSPSPLLRPREPTRKYRCVHFSRFLLSPSLDLHSLGHVGTG